MSIRSKKAIYLTGLQAHNSFAQTLPECVCLYISIMIRSRRFVTLPMQISELHSRLYRAHLQKR